MSNVIQYVKLFPDSQAPERATGGAIGYDVFAYGPLKFDPKEKINKYEGGLPFCLEPGQKVLIGIGVAFAVPWPVDCQVRPRSGLANKHDIELSNSPGTIDPDFRGNAGVLLRNRGNKPFMIEKGMRIAQLIFVPAKLPVFEEKTELPPTKRGNGGFGSTGLMEIKEGTAEFWREIRRLDCFFMRIAIAASERSNCVRGCKKDSRGQFIRDAKGNLVGQTRKFGCVIVKDDNVVSYGFNAQAPGMALCAEVGCLREAEKIPSGTNISRCRAVHAEEMAFLKMLKSGVGTPTLGATFYCTAEPCEMCAKSLAGSGIETLVVIKGIYPENGIQIVQDAGINLRYLEKELFL